MATKVEKWQAQDGSLHDSEVQAARHEYKHLRKKYSFQCDAVYRSIELLGGKGWEERREQAHTDEDLANLLLARCAEVSCTPRHPADLTNDLAVAEKRAAEARMALKAVYLAAGGTEAAWHNENGDTAGEWELARKRAALTREFADLAREGGYAKTLEFADKAVWDALEMLGGHEWESRRAAAKDRVGLIKLLHARCLEVANHPAHLNLVASEAANFEETAFAVMSLMNALGNLNHIDAANIADKHHGRLGVMEAAHAVSRAFVYWCSQNADLDKQSETGPLFAYLLEAQFGSTVLQADGNWDDTSDDKMRRLAIRLKLPLINHAD